ncbi:MAG: helix-turn-helix transcriptional regulator [Chloroflexota bacterium]
MKSQVITPQKRLDLIPFQPYVTSSDLGWPSLRLEDYRNLPPSNLTLPPMDHHILAFHYKPPSGTLAHHCGEKTSRGQMQPYDITYVPANRDNGWHFGTSDPHCLHILIKHSFVTQTALQICDIDISHLQFQPKFQLRDPQMRTFAALFQAELAGFGVNGPLFAESLSTALTVYLLKNYGNLTVKFPSASGYLSNKQLQQTIAMMQDHCLSGVSLKALAANLNLSPYHFARLFRKTMGIPPHQYFMQLRLEKAQSMLLTQGELSIAGIAQATGFSDQSHLTTQFNNHFGITPKQYRAIYA